MCQYLMGYGMWHGHVEWGMTGMWYDMLCQVCDMGYLVCVMGFRVWDA